MEGRKCIVGYVYCQSFGMEKVEFIQKIRDRTKAFAVKIIKKYGKWPKNDEIRIIGKQLIRSSTSVAANYRAVCRARSKAEFFAKLCIVVEEADETLFWLEVLEEAELVKAGELQELQKEITELLSIFAKARKNTE